MRLVQAPATVAENHHLLCLRVVAPCEQAADEVTELIVSPSQLLISPG